MVGVAFEKTPTSHGCRSGRPLVVDVPRRRSRVHERAVAERLGRDRGEPVVADRVAVGETVQHGERGRRVAVHDDARIGVDRCDRVLGVVVGDDCGVVVHEPLHPRHVGPVRHRGIRGVEERRVDVLEQLARVGVRVVEHRLLPRARGAAAGDGIRQHLAREPVERLAARHAPRVVQPPDDVVEGPVLHHQHDDVVDVGQPGRGCGDGPERSVGRAREREPPGDRARPDDRAGSLQELSATRTVSRHGPGAYARRECPLPGV